MHGLVKSLLLRREKGAGKNHDRVEITNDLCLSHTTIHCRVNKDEHKYEVGLKIARGERIGPNGTKAKITSKDESPHMARMSVLLLFVDLPNLGLVKALLTVRFSSVCSCVRMMKRGRCSIELAE